MVSDNRTQAGAPAVIDTSMGAAPAATRPVARDTIINAVYNGDKGYGAPDTGALYRIRHTTENARAAVKAAARAYMEARGGIHPETPGRGPWQASFTWGDAVTLLPEEPDLLARHGILDIAVLDIVPDVVVNHDEDLLP